ncbi:hypothetical protein TVAG_468000 [Trichomonas vaginalis G3]|uniref:Vacuolar protein sorting-associated protein 35 n=1 Tax=Trichomonas vaginalis (strain ATCC PRA-98 / G3) TaxID=412133 RepID=A2E0N9_TRIV3|nr:vacuolar protein sorting-associated protein 35 family [Trichomonas vaginalis G3]EAY13784.1 hypothetical protein TVAG_468000 [Trichomonas vaginalis G3]KAI5542700.1 vacuolar protein sorting-associated protein 35 family [Trichomonas vaginalis G3]|eukprot:XP_001326007.1 hypothetical protein [Trichomonas vaginalis G3]
MTEVAINAPENFTGDDVQKKLLDENIEKIDGYSFLMARCLDNGDINGAINHAISLIDILAIDSLTPRNYYSLYHPVSTALFQLNNALGDELKVPSRKIAELYETVQYNESALERLYLMVTIAPELSKRKIIRVLDVLDDLTDMLKQAQDPIRALFLRHYTLSIFKQALPDSNDIETERSLDFLLGNFAQMNRMWVRIEDIMATDSRREQRVELSVLIGTNIQRISALHGLTINNYSTIILPFLAKHVELCEDSLGQEFILQSIIQAFPEEYHVATIDDLFSMFGKVEQGVRILLIVNQLLERFLNYLGHLVDQEKASNIFVVIAKNIEELFNSEGHLALVDKFETLQKLLKFALKVDPTDVRNVKALLKFTDFHIDLAIGDEVLTSPEASFKLRDFLTEPLTIFESASSLFSLEFLPTLISRLMPPDRISIAGLVCDLFLKSGTKIASMEQLKFVLSMTATLVRDSSGASCFFALFHLIDADSVMDTMMMIQELANAMDDATEKAAQRAVLPIGFVALKQIEMTEDDDERKKLLKFINAYAKNNVEENALGPFYLFVEAAKEVDSVKLGLYANEFMNSAIEIWQKMPENRQKQQALTYLINFVCSSTCIDLDVNSVLCNAVGNIQDTIKAITSVCNCANLFWRKDQKINDVEKVQACLAKASRLAATATDQTTMLKGFYTVLSWTAYFQEVGCKLNETWINALVQLINEKHEVIVSKGLKIESVVPLDVKKFYVNTVKYIKDQHLFPNENGTS